MTTVRALRQSREGNPNWRGGRTTSSHGYVLIRVGTEHHLADVRGYAYEHRVVAERKIGRRLRRKEQVHHINGDRQDNGPENLEVMASIAHHRVRHRTGQGRRRRLPGEANPTIPCRCKCGETLARYDELGRPREYVSGHNPMPSPTLDAVRAALKWGPQHRVEIAARIGRTVSAVAQALSKLKRRGEAKSIGGRWRAME